MNNRICMVARIIVMLTGIGFIAIGVIRGEMVIVLRKAIMVCLECIGLG